MLVSSRVRSSLLALATFTDTLCDVGLKRMDDGSTEKEFEDREQEFALQSTVQNVTSEDVRYVVRCSIMLLHDSY